MTTAVLDMTPVVRADDEHVNWKASFPFFLVHVLPFATIWTGVPTKAWVLCIVLYVARMLPITAFYHRYFSHRAFETNRFWQFVFGAWGTTAIQKGPIWWSSKHKPHHIYSDKEEDIHSPRKGIFWSHCGWILCNKHKQTDPAVLEKYRKVFPELVLLEKYDAVAPWLLGIGVTWYGWTSGWKTGMSCLFFGFFLSTVLVWHFTFATNSWNHKIGRQRFNTGDDSRNSALLAPFTLGENWHNNHHMQPNAARNGFYWWQIDVTFYFLWVLSKLRIIRNLRRVHPEILLEGRRKLPKAA